MDSLTWLRFVIEGGALVVLVVVLFGIWKLAGRFIDTMDKQVAQVQDGIRIQTQLQDTTRQLVDAVVKCDTHVQTTEDKVLAKLDEHECESEKRHTEVMRRIGIQQKGR